MNDNMILLTKVLKHAVQEIESGKCYATEKQFKKAATLLGYIFSPVMSRQEVMEELGICDTTLRKRIKSKDFPQGKKIRGQTAHSWTKAEVEEIKHKGKNNNKYND